MLSVREFAKFDRFLSETPNANTLSLEAMMMLTNNKTASWLNSKMVKEREESIRQACSITCEIKRLYRNRRQKLLEEHAKLLQAKSL